MTIAEKVAELKKQEAEAAREASERAKIEHARKKERIREVEKQVLASLREYKPKARDFGVHVRFGHRDIYITIGYEMRKVRYADDCDEETVWSLEIGIGFLVNRPDVITGIENFESSFISFLRRNRLV